MLHQNLISGLAIVLATACVLHAEEAGYLKVKDLTPVTIHRAPKHAPVEIVRNRKPRAKVYLAEADPSQNLKFLIDEFGRVIKLSTGAEVEVVKEMPPASQPAIVIGDCEASRKAGIDAAKISIEGFVVRTAPNRVFLVGSTKNLPEVKGHNPPYSHDSTAWAVADFLERFVGVRWYWPSEVGGRSIVKADTLVVRPAHYSDQPVFRKREYFPTRFQKPWGKSRWFDKTSPAPPIPPELEKIDMLPYLATMRSGNSWPYMIKVHQPQHFWEGEKKWGHLKAMFQKKEDGSTFYPMLCYSSQEAFEYLMKGCEAVWDQDQNLGGWPWVTTTCVTISPGDYPVRCYCEKCNKLHNSETVVYGQASKVMCLFVTKFCDEVKRRWPDKKVLYLPYWNYTLPAEGIEYPDNLEIQMCTMATGLMRQRAQRKLMEDGLRAWSKAVGGPVQTWEYPHRVVGWTHAPLQYPHLIQDYYHTNRDILVGSFLNGDNSTNEWSTTAPTLYCYLKVLWNPDVDVDAIMDVMCERLFGKASGTTRELMQLTSDRWEKARWSESVGDAGRIPAKVFTDTWPKEVVAEMEKLRRQAREQMKDDRAALGRFDYWAWTFEAFLTEAEEAWAKAKQ